MSKAKYGAAHRRARSDWAKTLNARGSLPCSLCPEPVHPWQEWHLDHVPGTSDQYRGVAHSHCNEVDGGKLGGGGRTAPKPRPLVL